MENIVYELKGMMTMLECAFERDDALGHDEFEAINSKVKELVEIIEK